MAEVREFCVEAPVDVDEGPRAPGVAGFACRHVRPVNLFTGAVFFQCFSFEFQDLFGGRGQGLS